MTQSRTPRLPYSATSVALILVVICAATVFAAARVGTAPTTARSATLAASTSADPQKAEAWLFP